MKWITIKKKEADSLFYSFLGWKDFFSLSLCCQKWKPELQLLKVWICIFQQSREMRAAIVMIIIIIKFFVYRSSNKVVGQLFVRCLASYQIIS